MSRGSARVFVPAHVTGFFSVHRASNPLAAGSRGAGVTLADGVHVAVRRADEGGLTVDGEATTVAPVERVLDALDASPRIEVESDVPIGAGFGVSGAIALGTAIGVNHVYGRDRSENDLVRIAHRAEVSAGTGLGDVVAQHRGGAPIRLEPGAPGYGQLDGIPDRRVVEYVSFGELSTAAVLGGDTEQINQAGEAALEVLQARPTLDHLVVASRRFARESGLATESIRGVLADAEAAGGSATMAMLGRTVFGFGTGLSDAGYEVTRCEMASGGVQVE